MIVLDTNVVSELTRTVPERRVVRWVDGQAALAITAITVAELFSGVARLPDGARRSALVDAVRDLTEVRLGDSVLAFDRAACPAYAEIVTARERAGRPISMADAQIAAICRVANAALATRTVRDFDGTGIRVIDPWDVRSDRRGW